jgi:broad specificity phosphatase PhoE
MKPVRFWLLRHALVEARARAVLYGAHDVPLCPETLAAERPLYERLAARLPQPARWLVSPLSRTRETARAIFAAGYPAQALAVEPALIEQTLGAWEGLPQSAVAALFARRPDQFWPLPADTRPPGGESMADVVARVGVCLTRLAATHGGEDVVAVVHGGVIRAALAHVLGIAAEQAQNVSVGNLSLTRFEWHREGWWIGGVNEAPDR